MLYLQILQSLKNHFDTYKVYKEFYLKTKNKELDPIYENENNLNFDLTHYEFKNNFQSGQKGHYHHWR